MDEVSSQGYAWGYIGSCVPFVICLLVVLNAGKIGITMEIAMMVSFVIITVWWVIMTLPLLKTYHQKYYVEKKQRCFFRKLQKNRHYTEKCKKEKKVFLFLLAFFLFILTGFIRLLIWQLHMDLHLGLAVQDFFLHCCLRRS